MKEKGEITKLGYFGSECSGNQSTTYKKNANAKYNRSVKKKMNL